MLNIMEYVAFGVFYFVAIIIALHLILNIGEDDK